MSYNIVSALTDQINAERKKFAESVLKRYAELIPIISWQVNFVNESEEENHLYLSESLYTLRFVPDTLSDYLKLDDGVYLYIKKDSYVGELTISGNCEKVIKYAVENNLKLNAFPMETAISHMSNKIKTLKKLLKMLNIKEK